MSCLVQIVHWLAQYKSKQLVKHHLVKHILQVLFQLCAEPDPADYGDDDDQLSPSKFASQVYCT